MNPPQLPQEHNVESVRLGQKLVIYALLLNLASLPVKLSHPGDSWLIAAGLVELVAIIISIVGILRMSRGLSFHWGLQLLCCLLILLPFVNFLTLLVLNAKATRYLRAAGLEVGLLGAARKK